MAIKNGDKVKVHYTGKLKDGTVFDSSVEREPFEFEIGSGSVIKGFEQNVLTMQIGEKKSFDIPFAEAYGDYLADLVREYPVEALNGAQVTPGQLIFMQSNDGRQFPCQVKEVNAENILVDFNHPLAGKDLNFELELLAIN